MNKRPQERYHHYPRPKTTRASKDQQHSGKGWAVTMTVIILVLLALIPLAYHLAHDHRGEQAIQVERVQKKPASKTRQQAKAKQQTSRGKKKLKKSLSTAKKYAVKSGDTLSSIAAKHDLSVTQLARLNHLSPSAQVKIGQTLRLK